MNRKIHRLFGYSARFCALLLVFLTLFSPGLADAANVLPAGLDGPLSRWLGKWQPLRFSASFRTDGLLPFLDEQLDSLNALLGHVALDAFLAEGGDETATILRLRCNQQPVMTFSEAQRAHAYTLQTDLLPNRTLESRLGSPLALLGETGEEWAPAPPPGTAEEEEGSAVPSGAFDFLHAINEAEGCYRALGSACEPYAVKKRTSYRIKNIGTARWSQTARLTPEQSDGMLPLLRDMLKCGMDNAFREELDQARFGKNFIVTLYKASEQGKDIAVYMKGTLIYPDGSTSKLAYQWAFVNNGVERTDSYKLEITPPKGARHTRLTEAFLTQKRFEENIALKGSSQLTLRQGKASETQLLKVDLSGKGNSGGRNLKGSWSEQIHRAETTDASTTTILTMTPDLRINAGPDGGLLSGQVQVERRLDKTVTFSLCLTFAPEVDFLTLSTEAGFAHRVDSTPNPAAAPLPTPTPLPITGPGDDEDVSLDLSFLVSDGPTPGSTPIGLTVHPIPADMTAVSLDGLSEEGRLNLMDEMGQRLAGRLLIALSTLPMEDIALLTDVLREDDLAAFPALFN